MLPAAPEKIKIIIADDHLLLREGFKSVLSNQSEIEIIGEASNGIELLELLESLSPTLVLMDIFMPKMCGITASKNIRSKYPNIHIIILSMTDDECYIKQASEIGVKGYLLKDAMPEELIMAVRTIYSGGRYYSKEISDKINFLICHDEANAIKRKSIPSFSSKELEIIKLICKGFISKEIADRLHLSKKTVDHYKERIQEKTEAKNAVEVAVYALLHNVITKDDLRVSD